ncbi:hypothetical protein Q9Q99_16380 [Curtobacterium flaccumfaciens]|nr:hypothetical protein Q9Q99_16380 [Curtobacterium flaccumfaciens]
MTTDRTTDAPRGGALAPLAILGLPRPVDRGAGEQHRQLDADRRGAVAARRRARRTRRRRPRADRIEPAGAAHRDPRRGDRRVRRPATPAHRRAGVPGGRRRRDDRADRDRRHDPGAPAHRDVPARHGLGAPAARVPGTRTRDRAACRHHRRRCAEFRRGPTSPVRSDRRSPAW